jgi:hypothetical protein
MRRLIRYRYQICWIRFLKQDIPVYSIRQRYDEQQQQQDLGIPKIVFEKTGHDEAGQRCQRRYRDPSSVVAPRLYDFDQTSVKFKDKPEESCQAQQPAFRRQLQDVVFQMTVINVFGRKVPASVVVGEFRMYTFRANTKQRVVLDHTHACYEQLDPAPVWGEIRLFKTHRDTMVDKAGGGRRHQSDRQANTDQYFARNDDRADEQTGNCTQPNTASETEDKGSGSILPG